MAFQLTLQVTPLVNGQYIISFVLETAGLYQFSLVVNSEEKFVTPLILEATAGDVSASTSAASGDGLIDARRGIETSFTIYLVDEYGNPIVNPATYIDIIITSAVSDMSAASRTSMRRFVNGQLWPSHAADFAADLFGQTSPRGVRSAPPTTPPSYASVDIREIGDGEVLIVYTISQSGSYLVQVLAGGEHLPQSPVALAVLATCIPVGWVVLCLSILSITLLPSYLAGRVRP